MKRIAYSCLLVFLLSCGHSAPSSENRIVLQLRDSLVRSYSLLSVRNNALIIAPYSEQSQSSWLLQNARSVSFSEIEVIYYSQEHSSSSVLADVLGTLGGTAAGCAVGGYRMKDEGDLGTLFGFGALGGTVGLTTAILLTTKSSTDEKLLDLTRESDLADLRNRAFYQTEPAELQRIK